MAAVTDAPRKALSIEVLEHFDTDIASNAARLTKLSSFEGARIIVCSAGGGQLFGQSGQTGQRSGMEIAIGPNSLRSSASCLARSGTVAGRVWAGPSHCASVSQSG